MIAEAIRVGLASGIPMQTSSVSKDPTAWDWRLASHLLLGMLLVHVGQSEKDSTRWVPGDGVCPWFLSRYITDLRPSTCEMGGGRTNACYIKSIHQSR